MRTWSLESAFVSAYSTAAVAVQGVLDKFATLERITRPPRQPWGDVDSVHDGAEQLAEREAEEEVSEPRPPGFYTMMAPEWADLHYGFPYPPKDKERHIASDGGEWVFNNLGGGEWDAVTYPPTGDPYFEIKARERAADTPNPTEPRPVCACCFERERTQDGCLCDYCIQRGVDQDYYSRHEDTPNLTEPGLTPDELVGVRGLLQERYAPPPPISCPVDDCEFTGHDHKTVNTHSYWEHLQINPFKPSGDPLIEYRRYPGIDDHGDFRWFNVKATIGTPKSSASVIPTGADAEPNSPAAESAPAGESAGEVSGIPPSPSPACPDLATWLEPAVWTALEPHEPHDGVLYIKCCREQFHDWQAWREHVSKPMGAHIAQALPDYPKAAAVLEEDLAAHITTSIPGCWWTSTSFAIADAVAACLLTDFNITPK